MSRGEQPMEGHDNLRAYVDHDHCAGVSQCVRIAPNVFRLDDEQLSVFDPSGPWTPDDLHAAAENCPMEAIRIETAHP